MELPDLYRIIVIVHIFGVALGAGGAFLSDAMFFKALRDRRISSTELGFLRVGSTAVWIGLGILIFSGIWLALQHPEWFADSDKFWAKMTVVAIIFFNGILFREKHLPLIDSTQRASAAVFISGAISIISWVSAIILGGLRGVPYTYGQIMGVYLLVVAAAVSIALLLYKKYFSR